MKKETVGDDKILNIFNERKILISKGRYNIDAFEDRKREFPDNFENLEEALSNYTSENDLKSLKTYSLIKWNFLI